MRKLDHPSDDKLGHGPSTTSSSSIQIRAEKHSRAEPAHALVLRVESTLRAREGFFCHAISGTMNIMNKVVVESPSCSRWQVCCNGHYGRCIKELRQHGARAACALDTPMRAARAWKSAAAYPWRRNQVERSRKRPAPDRVAVRARYRPTLRSKSTHAAHWRKRTVMGSISELTEFPAPSLWTGNRQPRCRSRQARRRRRNRVHPAAGGYHSGLHSVPR